MPVEERRVSLYITFRLAGVAIRRAETATISTILDDANPHRYMLPMSYETILIAASIAAITVMAFAAGHFIR